MPSLRPTPTPDDSRQRAWEEFDAWYEVHFDYVWRSLKRLGVRAADVSDLTHDVFVVAWRQRTQLDPERPVRSWLFGVCFRLASSYRRRAWFRYVRFSTDDESTDWRPGPELATVMKAELTALQHALAEVPFKQRAVLLLHDFDEVPVAEVASALGIPPKTVYSRLDAARKRFRQAYRQQELTRPTKARVPAVSPGECP